MKNAVIKSYDTFNGRRYSNPRVALVDSHGHIDTSQKVGAYTGSYGRGEAGKLYVYEPVEGQVYAYWQYDYRRNSKEIQYVLYHNDQFLDVPNEHLLEALCVEQ